MLACLDGCLLVGFFDAQADKYRYSSVWFACAGFELDRVALRVRVVCYLGRKLHCAGKNLFCN